MAILNPQNTDNTSTERRSYSRIPFSAEIVMQSGDEEWSCNLLDISLKGMLVEPPSELNLNINNPCAMALFLGDDTSIHARVKIAHVNDNGNWGLEWLHIDVDSLKHLRRLLELNLKDPVLLNRELAELG